MGPGVDGVIARRATNSVLGLLSLNCSDCRPSGWLSKLWDTRTLWAMSGTSRPQVFITLHEVVCERRISQ
jgi:hypothetical protein